KVGLYSSFASIERLVFTDNYDAPSVLKANAEVVYTDINTYVEGLYSATFITHDNSGNYSNPFTLLVVVSRDEMTSGVDDLDLDEVLSIAPNPSAGIFNVMVDLPENEDITVGVYNSMGQKVSDVVN